MHYTTFLWGRKIYNNRLFFLNLAACDLNKTWQSLVGGNLSLLFVLLVRSTFVRAHVDCNYIKLLVQCLLCGIATSLANFRTTSAGKCCIWECQHCSRASLEPPINRRWLGMLLSASHPFLISFRQHLITSSAKQRLCTCSIENFPIEIWT